MKTIIELREQLQSKDRAMHELNLRLVGAEGGESMEQIKAKERALRGEVTQLREEVSKLTAKISMDYVEQKSSITFEQLLKQKNKDYDILMDEFEKRAKLESVHLDQIKFMKSEN